nr:negative transcriptional regulator of cel operon [Raoultella sp. NCTC 9187]
MNHTRDIPQTFWRDAALPWLELRSTWDSRRAYKRHSHRSFRWGLLLRGKRAVSARDESTCCNPVT